MSVSKAVIAKKVNGTVEYIYPKTSADMVDCGNNTSVQEKIESLESTNTALNNKINSFQGGMKYVNSAEDMIDTSRAYVYDGEWYYYDSTTESWISGGDVAGLETDTTLTVSGAAADAAVVGNRLMKTQIVEQLPVTGTANTIYLISKGVNKGYDKYWYITDNGVSKWDVFGGSSTEIVNSLPNSGDEDVDYVLVTNNGYFYYKWINNDWRVIGGSMATIVDDIDNLPETGNELTDYYVAQSNGSYQHYRWKDAEDENEESEYHIVGGDSYTKSEVDTLLSPINSNISSLQTSMATANSNITLLQQDLENIDDEVYKYTATYGTVEIDGEETENVFRLYKYKGDEPDLTDDDNIVEQFVIQGGSGGNQSTTLTVEKITASPIVVTSSDSIVLKYTYSSVDSDNEQVDGTYTWKLNNTQIASGLLRQGQNEFDVTKYINTAGTYKLMLTVRDYAGNITSKSWTINKIEMYVTSSFTDSNIYDINRDINFKYTPFGAIDKTIHIKLDGQEIYSGITRVSGIEQTYTINAATYAEHGSHLIECYATATINEVAIETDHVYKNLIWSDSTGDPIIACIYRYDLYGKIEALQYDTTPINYFIYDPAVANNGTVTVIHKEGSSESEQNIVNGSNASWAYMSETVGDHTLEIKCKNTTVEIKVKIKDLGITVQPVMSGLQFDFNPSTLTNADANRLWKDANNENIALSVSENFDWVNGGYQIDSNNNKCFCIKAGTTATFNYKLFKENAGVYGSEFKCVFKTTNVKRADATFLNCVSGNVTPVGLQMNVHEAYLKVSSGSLHIPYSENDVIEFEFNINPISGDDQDAVIMSYEDGVALRPLIYPRSARLYQLEGEETLLTFGSPYCDVYIYRMKAYNTSLTDSNILANFIADARTASEMVSRYNRNQIYDENNVLTPESVAHACPDLRVIKIECPYFTNDKNNFVKYTNVQCIYEHGDPVLDNWQFINCYHSGQGTSSNRYGISGRNIDIIMCADGKDQISSKINKTAAAVDQNYITELILGDDTRYSYNGNLPFDENTNNKNKVKVSLSRTSVPNNWFNIKVNIASSENANNALLQKRFNDYLPYTTIAMSNDPKCKNSMEFYNCVIFVKESNADLTTHREFNDTNWHFYGIGNIGDSKKTDATRVNNINDIKEFAIEFSDNTLPNSTFQTGVYWANAEKTQTTFDVAQSVAGMKYPITKVEWENENNIARKCLYGLYTYTKLNDDNEEEEVTVTWDDSFEFRYDMGGDTKDGATIQTTSEQKAAQRLRNKQILRDFYEWVVTCPDNRFASELEGWFIKDSALYWYLFTERYTMIDSRAKNTFYHFADVGDYHIVPYPNSLFMDMYYEKDGNEYTLTEDTSVNINKTYYWRYAFEMWDYDNDTALGIDNNGDMVFPYGKEDTDILNGTYVFNAADSVFWCRIRDLMYSDLASLYNSIEDSGNNCWKAQSLITEFDNWQNQFPEELWRLDIQRKYYRVYLGQSIDNSIVPLDESGNIKKDSSYLTTKLNGRKKYHRRQFERDQEAYIATKYITKSITNNSIWFRSREKDENSSIAADYSLSVVPYSDMYINIEVGNSNGSSNRFRRRALAGQEYSFTMPTVQSGGDNVVTIYCGNRIQAINDLSRFYMQGNSFGAGTKLQRLVIGNATEGYVNRNITSLDINSPLLEELDIRNCPNLNTINGLSTAIALKRFYADNTIITDASFAPNGKLTLAHLPITINTLSLEYLNDLVDLKVGYSNNASHYDNIESLVIRNTDIDSKTIVEDCIDTLINIILSGIEWTEENNSALDDISLLEAIYAKQGSEISGNIYIDDDITDALINKYKDRWPNLNITFNTSKIKYAVYYINEGGSIDDPLGVVYINNGQLPPGINDEGYPVDNTPTKADDTNYQYEFSGWSSNIENVINVDDSNPNASLAARTYTAQYEISACRVYYVDDDENNTPLTNQVIYVPVGETAPDITVANENYSYTPISPIKHDYNTEYIFNSWTSNINNIITANSSIAARTFTVNYVENAYAVAYKNYNGTETLLTVYVQQGEYPPDVTVANVNYDYTPILPTKPNDELNGIEYVFDHWADVSGSTPLLLTDSKVLTQRKEFTAQFVDSKYLVTYMNYDDSQVLARVYVPIGEVPPDITAANANYDYTPIATPTKPITERNYYVFAGWDKVNNETAINTTGVVVRPVFTENLRTFTVTWYSGLPGSSEPLYSVSGIEYGSEAVYAGDELTTYNNGSRYYVFKGWNKNTGSVKTDITDVTGVWDSATLPPEGTQLEDMTPAQIYAVTDKGFADDYFEMKDHFDMTLGNDLNFDDVTSQVLANDLFIDGTEETVIDTGIHLFGDNEQSFTLAIDFTFSSPTEDNTLVSCFDNNGADGFRLSYSSCYDKEYMARVDPNNTTNLTYVTGTLPCIQWGDYKTQVGNIKYINTNARNNLPKKDSLINIGSLRQIVVIRHIAGDNKLYIYKRNRPHKATYFDGYTASSSSSTSSYYDNGSRKIYTAIRSETASRTRSTYTNESLILGAIRNSTGDGYTNIGRGVIHWCKIWYDDLGASNATMLASWIHEPLRMHYCGSGRYDLADGSGKTRSTFIANNALADYLVGGKRDSWSKGTIDSKGENNSNTITDNTEGLGYNKSEGMYGANNYVYKSIPIVWKNLIKQVSLPVSVPNQSYDGSNYYNYTNSYTMKIVNCYLHSPCYTELSNHTYFKNSYRNDLMKEARLYEESNTIIPWFADRNSDPRVVFYSDSISATNKAKFYNSYSKLALMGIIIPDNATIYVQQGCGSANDPVNTYGNNVKFGDIWASNYSSTLTYIFVSSDYYNKYFSANTSNDSDIKVINDYGVWINTLLLGGGIRQGIYSTRTQLAYHYWDSEGSRDRNSSSKVSLENLWNNYNASNINAFTPDAQYASAYQNGYSDVPKLDYPYFFMFSI